MAFGTIEMNLTALNNISSPNINITNSNVFSEIISTSNTYASDFLIFASMIIIFIIMYLTLSDKTPFQDFGYDDMRALNIALSTSSLIGLTIISVGWSSNFFAVGMFTTLWVVSLFAIYIYENEE